MTGLRVRKPTGRVAYPVIVVEGGEKVGKTYAALQLSASEKVGRTFVLDLGEGSADEYAALGPYEVVDHDGTFADLMGQLKLAAAEPMVDGKPNVIVLDSGTVLWESIKDWADARARRGNNAKKILANDPDADVSIPMNIWTDAADRWGQMIHVLRYWDGIAVLICRGKEVAKVDGNGNPIAKQTDYKVEAHKSTLFQASAHVRCIAPKQVRLMSVRSLHAAVPAAGLALPDGNPLEHLVFDVLGAGEGFGSSSAVAPQIGRPVVDVKKALVDLFAGKADPTGEATAVWAASDCAELTRADEVSDEQWAGLVAAVTVRIAEAEAS